MPQIRTPPAILALVAPLLRRMRPAGQLPSAWRKPCGLAVMLLPALALGALHQAPAEGADRSEAAHDHLSAFWSDLTWLPSQMDQALGGMMGPNGITLATGALLFLPMALWALLILQEGDGSGG